MNTQFQRLTADIITSSAFGSNYLQGKEVFQAQIQLQSLCVAAISNIDIPDIFLLHPIFGYGNLTEK
ncbi:hypothetical protein SLE2022_330680 [Rubroshorea leprosula]